MSIEELFCLVDDFCTVFMVEWMKLLIASGAKKRQRHGRLSVSEIITILLLFQQSHYRDFKTFYLNHVCCHLRREFPELLSYTRFVALIPSILIPLCAFLQSIKSASEGIAFIDSTPIAVCHPKRISSHKVFAGIADIGKTTKGWFYGFKLHLVINHRGEFCACRITAGNVNDRDPVPEITKELLGKLFADKGYIGQKLFDQLLDKGLQLITGIRKNMKNRLMSQWDKLMLRKRSLIESVNHQLKNVFQIEHSRHRSVFNGFANMICAIIAFALHPRKPSIQLTPKEINILATA
jgi:hypothetical protein